jgi:hypothetical protein
MSQFLMGMNIVEWFREKFQEMAGDWEREETGE